jgi:hypothetical protein
MTMTPRFRKFVLTAHITASVGWLGAVACFLALAVAAMTSNDVQTVRAANLAMELTGRLVLVPLSLASLLTGIIQSLGTKWGLFQHYWVLAKLLINVLATAILLMYTQTLSYLAGVATQTTLSSDKLNLLRSPSPILHAGAALLILLVATILSVYKPQGLTRYGWRKQQEKRNSISEKGVRLF